MGSDSIRVLHIISGNDDGGAKIHLLNLCNHSKRLFDNVIGSINTGSLTEQADALNLKTIVFQQENRMDFRILNNIITYINKNKFDIVNFHGARPNFLYMAMKNNITVPCVTTIHSDYRYDFINNRFKYILFTPLNIMALKSFNNYICVSSKIKELLEQKGFKGFKYVVNNGVDTAMKISVKPDEIRKRYNIPPDVFVYVMVARMHPIKNHIALIEAFKILFQEYQDVRLLLVGSGDFESSVIEKVKELNMDNNVVFAGKQSNPLDYINTGDINILTSINETFPIVILEGALIRKTAICSDVGDIKDIIKDKSGFIINPASVEDIYLKMKDAYLRRSELNNMGDILHDIVVKDYSIDRFCERYYESYNSILTGEKNG